MDDPVLSTISQFSKQLKASWDAVSTITLPESSAPLLNVVLCGMGGSALGGRIVHALTAENCKVPFEVVTGYNIPFYVGPQTLVILCSYSGSTEETIQALHQAKDKGARLFVISTGGELTALASDFQIPCYTISPEFNPSKQPRLALGYNVGSLLALFNKLNIAPVSFLEMTEGYKKVDDYTTEFMPEMVEENNEAKKLTKSLSGRVPILIASEHLIGSVHAFKNQLNETAKTFSALFDLPELNHHLLEGLQFPTDLKKQIVFMFFESELYTPRVQKRYAITKEVLEKQGYNHISYKAHSAAKLTQVFEVLTLGSFIQYYLALSNKARMMEIPWVDYFKEKMARD